VIVFIEVLLKCVSGALLLGFQWLVERACGVRLQHENNFYELLDERFFWDVSASDFDSLSESLVCL